MGLMSEASKVAIAVAREPDEARVSLGGEIDMSNLEEVRAALTALLDDPPRRVVFQLGSLTFMDSSALALMIEVSQRVGSVVLESPSETVVRVLEATGLTEVLPVQS